MKRKGAFFEEVPIDKVNRNFFDLSHSKKMTGKFGYLYPVLCMDVLPGDHISDQIAAFSRFMPLVSPAMHRCDIRFNAFYVPDRIIIGMDLTEDFFGSGQSGGDTSVLPYMRPADITNDLMDVGTLWDHIGLPPRDGAGGSSTEQISIRAFYAYQKIWSDWFRDPNFDTEIEFPIETQGNVSVAAENADMFLMRRRGWRRDAFTSALPQAQRGGGVMMPLEGVANSVVDADGDPIAQNSTLGTLTGVTPGLLASQGGDPGYPTPSFLTPTFLVFENSGVSINDFRLALAVQRWMENSMRGGSRYNEMTLVNFNVQTEDYRTQRAEYLGGHSQRVEISEVLSTANTEVGAVETPVGQLAGRAVSFGRDGGWSYHCKEHGWIVVLMSVMPDSNYSQGLPRWAIRQSRYDFGWPLLANIGEQEVLSKEVFWANDAAEDVANNSLFGYNPRYWDYKYIPDSIAGDFRTTLQFWHLSRIFTARPTLDQFFTTMYEAGEDAVPPDVLVEEVTYRRIFAVQDGTDYIIMEIFHNLKAMRALPYYGVPAGLGS